MENWKLCKEFEKVHQQLYLPGDKIYVNDKGGVKFNDIVLSLDYGLYVGKGIGGGNKQYDIKIPEFKWPEGTLYRLIYKLFVGELKPHMHIHHKDFNHLNNNADNLIQVTNTEHRRLHKGDNNIDKDNLLLIETTKESYNKFYNYLKDRYIDYCTNLKQKEIDEKLSSGLYKYDKNGKLCRTTTAKKGYVTPPEVRLKQSIAIKKLYTENEEYRNTNKMQRCTGKGCKYVKGEDGKLHRTYAA